MVNLYFVVIRSGVNGFGKSSDQSPVISLPNILCFFKEKASCYQFLKDFWGMTGRLMWGRPPGLYKIRLQTTKIFMGFERI
jgi:hypothetical protein